MRMAAAQSADVRIPGPWGSVDALGDELDGLVVLKIIAVSSNGERLGLESGDHSHPVRHVGESIAGSEHLQRGRPDTACC
jgi:hypothetical protein